MGGSGNGLAQWRGATCKEMELILVGARYQKPRLVRGFDYLSVLLSGGNVTAGAAGVGGADTASALPA